MDGTEVPWHSIADPDDLLRRLGTTEDGLSSAEAERRLQQ